MFQSLSTLHNCVIFPNITALSQNHTGPDFQTVRQLYSLDETSSATSANVIDKLSKCFAASCTATDGCEIPTAEPFLYTLDYGYRLIENLCDNIPATINSDIGGVGVSDVLCGQNYRH